MESTELDLKDVTAAQERISMHVRRTPLLSCQGALPFGRLPEALWLKLECLQITGSFKVRGALNKLLALPAEQRGERLVTASGGNHGLGIAYAGRLLGLPVTIYLPETAPAAKAEALQTWGAEVCRQGAVWDETNAAALAAAERSGWTYIHPFDDPFVVAGQGTIGLEIIDQLSDVETVVTAIGGGGLISGVVLALKALRPSVRVFGVEPVGAPTLHHSIRADDLIELPSITTAAATLAPRRSAALNFGIVRRLVDDIVLVDDEEMRQAAQWLWRELRLGVELSGAAAVAALAAARVPRNASRRTCAIICGAGQDGLTAL